MRPQLPRPIAGRQQLDRPAAFGSRHDWLIAEVDGGDELPELRLEKIDEICGRRPPVERAAAAERWSIGPFDGDDRVGLCADLDCAALAIDDAGIAKVARAAELDSA